MIQLLPENRWAKGVFCLLFFLLSLAIIAYLTGYFYLWHIKQNAFDATLLTSLQYWIYYGHIPEVRRVLVFFTSISALMTWSVFIYVLWPTKTRSQFGDARFAKYSEIKRAGLFGNDGLILGAYRFGFFGLRKKFLLLAGQLGILLAAPPRSGKGASFVNTNNLNWQGSVVTLDIRKESWRVTSGFRSKVLRQKCYLFSPFDERGITCRWNPLSYVRENSNRINDLQKIANMLFPDPERGDTFWMASSRTLFLGIGLFLFETVGETRTIGQMLRTASQKDTETYAEHWGRIIQARGPNSTDSLSPTCLHALSEFSNTPEKTAGSIIKSFTSKLELWFNPIIDAATSGNSFDFHDFRKKRISLYLGVQPSDLERIRPLLNLMFQQILECNTKEMPEENLGEIKHQLLLNMDEFSAIGKIPIIANAVPFLGGYGIRLAIVIQSPSQLRSVYGIDIAETIMDCMGAQIIFAPRNTKIAEDISKSLGYKTVKSKSTSKAAGFGAIGRNLRSTGSVNTSNHGRALLLPQEVKQIGRDREIIFLEYELPIFAWKIKYFDEPLFKNRVISPAIQERIDITAPSHKKISNVALDFDLLSIGDDESEKLKEEFVRLSATDVNLIGKLDLIDFNANFESIELPKDPITTEEMAIAVSKFISTMLD